MANEIPALELDTAKFKAWMGEFIRALEAEHVGIFLRKVVFDFLNRVIPRTPVDKGRAAAGWTVYMEARGGGVPTITGPNVSHTAIQEGKDLGAFIEKLGRGTLQFIEIINGVPYIIKLEYGHSKKGRRFTRTTMMEIQRNLTRTAKGELRKAVNRANIKVGPL